MYVLYSGTDTSSTVDVDGSDELNQNPQNIRAGRYCVLNTVRRYLTIIRIYETRETSRLCYGWLRREEPGDFLAAVGLPLSLRPGGGRGKVL